MFICTYICLPIVQGVVVEESGSGSGGTTYRSVDEIGERASKAQGEDDVGGAGSSMVVSAEEQAAADMNVYEQYIIGMLTNLNNLPADRIHNMLKMFANDPPYDKSINEVSGRRGRASVFFHSVEGKKKNNN